MSRSRARGYTVVEVMLALAVMAVGTTGVVAMQRAALVGNTRARNLTTASTIGAAWLDRLKRDALLWRVKATGGTTLLSTAWLKVVGEDFPLKAGDEYKWIRPAVDATFGYSPMADVRGFDITDSTKFGDTAYCTHLRLTQILPNMIRAEVRVFWLRQHGMMGSQGATADKGAGTIGGKALCDADPAYIQDVSVATTRYHFAYMSGAVMQTGADL